MKLEIELDLTKSLLDQVEYQIIKYALESSVSQVAAANKLGMSVVTLRNRYKKYEDLRNIRTNPIIAAGNVRRKEALSLLVDKQYSVSMIAAELGVNHACISNHLKRELGDKEYKKIAKKNRYLNTKTYKRRMEKSSGIFG